ncbi:hypothetical protein [uncultured Brevundimonas sp.]|uniref:hypothetical protein n=1 Tax=uncultured Brevundimonas sp. TaxID=213418 RepID=UPI0025FF4CF7|nr:hypothetical protein [uncultured Brevundimonas sp.]
MLGSLLSIAHTAFQAVTAPIRNRADPRITALAAYSALKDEYRRALVAGDKRKQGELAPRVRDAMTARLRAETRAR